ncbi:MAG TPA: nitrogen fixation protein NifQ [Nitrospirota bacterium]
MSAKFPSLGHVFSKDELREILRLCGMQADVVGYIVKSCERPGPKFRRFEYDDLYGLLSSNVTDMDSRESEWLARIIAVACMGDDHLWQDMGLPSRSMLSSIMEAHFRPLHDLNSSDMKWKRFFYKRICEEGGFMLCKSPSCSSCIDRAKCFGPEE